jgi:hypothetical protein
MHTRLWKSDIWNCSSIILVKLDSRFHYFNFILRQVERVRNAPRVERCNCFFSKCSFQRILSHKGARALQWYKRRRQYNDHCSIITFCDRTSSYKALHLRYSDDKGNNDRNKTRRRQFQFISEVKLTALKNTADKKMSTPLFFHHH